MLSQLKIMTIASLLTVGAALAGEVNENHPLGAGKKQIALSFDDAPLGKGAFFSGMERSKMLIRELQVAKTPPVVFFCVTERLDWNEGLKRLKAYAGEGHFIGNHTHSHQCPADVGTEAYIEDILTAHRQLEGLPGFVPWFRYPMLDEGQGTMRDSIRQALKELGYRQGYVSVDTWDWYLDSRLKKAGKEGVSVDTAALGRVYVQVMMEQIRFFDDLAQKILKRSPRHVLLLHENDLAALFIADLIAAIRAEGWEIISPEAAYQDELYLNVPNTDYNNEGLISALAAAGGYTGPLRTPYESAAGLDSLLEAEGVLGR